jgi:hypothetical protein
LPHKNPCLFGAGRYNRPETTEEDRVKIGVISDTHLTGSDAILKAGLEDHFRGIDLILHAGDLVDLAVLEMFGPREVHAVYGNCDSRRARGLLPERLTLEVGGFRLALVHDAGSPLPDASKTGDPAGSVDCLVFGHTHRPVNRVKDGILYFNPGSATGNRCSPAATIGILEIGDGIRGEIIELRKQK